MTFDFRFGNEYINLKFAFELNVLLSPRPKAGLILHPGPSRSSHHQRIAKFRSAKTE